VERVSFEKEMKARFEQEVKSTLPRTMIPPKVGKDFVLLDDHIIFPPNFV
jgi:hypothetical protein